MELEMLKISGATHIPRATGHTEVVKKTWIPKYQVPVGKVIQTFLANTMAATEAVVGLIERKVLQRELKKKEKHSMSAVGRRKAGNALNSSLLFQVLGQVLLDIPLPITENKANDGISLFCTLKKCIVQRPKK